MALKDRVRILILSRYKSIRAFCVAAGIPYMTFVSALDKGLETSSVGVIRKASIALGVDMETLTDEQALINLGIYAPDEIADEPQMLKNLEKKWLMDSIEKADDSKIDKLKRLWEIVDDEEQSRD